VDRQSRTKIMVARGELPYGEAEISILWASLHCRSANGRAIRCGWSARIVVRRWDRSSGAGSGCGLFQLAGRGVQLAEFYRSHKFCGYCGHTMHPSKTEWAMLCSHCRERYYPQIAPCIIVAIRRDDSILLAQHTRHRNGVHTVLAGFVEVGETLEQAVAREVMEERDQSEKPALRDLPAVAVPAVADDGLYGGIRQRRDRYRQKELLDANWYRYDDLPLLPPPGTVARRLIEDTVAMCRAEYE
jgi:NAD+ diphosphatase